MQLHGQSALGHAIENIEFSLEKQALLQINPEINMPSGRKILVFKALQLDLSQLPVIPDYYNKK